MTSDEGSSVGGGLPTLLTLSSAAFAGALTAWLGFAPVGWWWFPYLVLPRWPR